MEISYHIAKKLQVIGAGVRTRPLLLSRCVQHILR